MFKVFFSTYFTGENLVANNPPGICVNNSPKKKAVLKYNVLCTVQFSDNPQVVSAIH